MSDGLWCWIEPLELWTDGNYSAAAGSRNENEAAMKGNEESHCDLEGVVGGQLDRFGDLIVARDWGQTEE